jgi:hypothetical protein
MAKVANQPQLLAPEVITTSCLACLRPQSLLTTLHHFLPALQLSTATVTIRCTRQQAQKQRFDSSAKATLQPRLKPFTPNSR